MPIDHAKLLAMRIPEVEATYTERDTMLYALSVGMGADPTDRRDLMFVTEPRTAESQYGPEGASSRGPLRTLPTMSTVVAWNDAWLYETGADMTKQVHGEQRITMHRPLPPAATVVASTRITDVFDKGPGRGAIMLFETAIRDRATGETLATNLGTSFARADGGFGGPSGSGPAPHRIPDRAPDAVTDLRTQPNQALFYRLCGDRNPLHSDPDYSERGGFRHPILHGLCTMGHACVAVVRAMCDWDADLIRELGVRFTAPVFPGETIRTELWREDGVVAFRSRVVERDVLVLDHGYARLR